MPSVFILCFFIIYSKHVRDVSQFQQSNYEYPDYCVFIFMPRKRSSAVTARVLLVQPVDIKGLLQVINRYGLHCNDNRHI